MEVFYSSDKKIHRKLLRNNISKIEKQTSKYESLIRSHRSYIVNVDKVSSVKGNLQGYQLYYENILEPALVSRSYSKAVKDKLN